jgi:hypothetical protein
VSSSLRQTIGDTLLSASGVVILVFALGATDHRVRDRATMLVTGETPLASATDAGGRVGGFAGNAFYVARGWAGDHQYLTAFGVAGVVLLAAVRRL